MTAPNAGFYAELIRKQIAGVQGEVPRRRADARRQLRARTSRTQRAAGDGSINMIWFALGICGISVIGSIALAWWLPDPFPPHPRNALREGGSNG